MFLAIAYIIHRDVQGFGPGGTAQAEGRRERGTPRRRLEVVCYMSDVTIFLIGHFHSRRMCGGWDGGPGQDGGAGARDSPVGQTKVKSRG